MTGPNLATALRNYETCRDLAHYADDDLDAAIANGEPEHVKAPLRERCAVANREFRSAQRAFERAMATADPDTVEWLYIHGYA